MQEVMALLGMPPPVYDFGTAPAGEMERPAGKAFFICMDKIYGIIHLNSDADFLIKYPDFTGLTGELRFDAILETQRRGSPGA